MVKIPLECKLVVVPFESIGISQSRQSLYPRMIVQLFEREPLTDSIAVQIGVRSQAS